MACTIRVNRHGYLAYRLYWHGIESHEGTRLRDTPANRAKIEARARVISDEMKAGAFDYLRWFPHGNKAHVLQPKAPALSTMTVREYAEQHWLPQKTPGFVRKSRTRDYRRHLVHIARLAGDVLLSDVTVGLLERVRRGLHDRGLAVKTIRNIVDGTFRAVYRDARREGIVTGDPFANLDWPRGTAPGARPVHRCRAGSTARLLPAPQAAVLSVRPDRLLDGCTPE